MSSEWDWFGDANTTYLFISLVILANHKDTFYRGKEIKRGQLLTGRKQLSNKTGLSQQTIRTCLNKLKSTNKLTIKSTNKFSVISIKNYNQYQQINQQTPNEQPTTNQQLTTSKNDKKDKNDKKINETQNNVKNLVGLFNTKNTYNDKDNNIIIKNNNRKNECVDLIIETFKKEIGFEPTDKKPRFEAWNLFRNIKTTYKEVKKDFDYEGLERHLTTYFGWLKKQSYFSYIENMSLVRRKYRIYQGNLFNLIKEGNKDED